MNPFDLTRRRAMALIGSSPFLTTQYVLACDDPPRHYPEPCEYGDDVTSPYFAIGDQQDIFERKDVKVAQRVLNDKNLGYAVAKIAISHINTIDAVRFKIINAPIKIIATPLRRVPVTFWAQDINSIGELKDRKIGVTGTAEYAAVESALDRQGLSLLEVGVIPFRRRQDAYSAVVIGKIDSVAVSAFERDIEKLDAKPFAKVEARYAETLLVAPSELMGDDKNIAFYKQFIAAMEDIWKYMRQNKNDVKTLFREELGAEERLADSLYRYYTPEYERIELDQVAVRQAFKGVNFLYPEYRKNLKAVDLQSTLSYSLVK